MARTVAWSCRRRFSRRSNSILSKCGPTLNNFKRKPTLIAERLGAERWEQLVRPEILQFGKSIHLALVIDAGSMTLSADGVRQPGEMTGAPDTQVLTWNSESGLDVERGMDEVKLLVLVDDLFVRP